MTEKRGKAVNGDVEAILREVRTVKVNGKPYAVCADLFRALGYRNASRAVTKYCRGAIKRRIFVKTRFRMTSVIPVEDMRRLAGDFVAGNRDNWDDGDNGDDGDDGDEAVSIIPVEYTKEEKKEREKRMTAERAASRYYGDKNLIF